MIEIRKGDVLSVGTGIIIHGCNCNGVMGAGIAKSIKERFPSAYDVYHDKHSSSGLKLGEISYVEVSDRKWIVNANTQQSTGNGRQVSYDAIADCFKKINILATLIMQTEKSIGISNPLEIVFPKIGAGLGGGDWNIISSIIDHTVSDDFKKVLYLID